MKELNVVQMEELHGGEVSIPRWLTCIGAASSTIGLFGSIFAGNIAGIIIGPTVAGAAIAACVG